MVKISKKLINDTKKMVRIKLFLDECGLQKYFNTVGELKAVSKLFKAKKK